MPVSGCLHGPRPANQIAKTRKNFPSIDAMLLKWFAGVDEECRHESGRAARTRRARSFAGRAEERSRHETRGERVHQSGSRRSWTKTGFHGHASGEHFRALHSARASVGVSGDGGSGHSDSATAHDARRGGGGSSSSGGDGARRNRLSFHRFLQESLNSAFAGKEQPRVRSDSGNQNRQLRSHPLVQMMCRTGNLASLSPLACHAERESERREAS